MESNPSSPKYAHIRTCIYSLSSPFILLPLPFSPSHLTVPLHFPLPLPSPPPFPLLFSLPSSTPLPPRCIERVRESQYSELSSELEITKANTFLRQKDIPRVSINLKLPIVPQLLVFLAPIFECLQFAYCKHSRATRARKAWERGYFCSVVPQLLSSSVGYRNIQGVWEEGQQDGRHCSH